MKNNSFTSIFRLLLVTLMCVFSSNVLAVTEIHVETAGTLSSLLTSTDKQLKLSGSINGTDIKFIRELISAGTVISLDLDAVRKMVAAYHVEAIVNCAAYTNVDAAESNEALAEKLNAEAPENLAKAMREVGGLLIQISTDYVFGKELYNVPCKEDQQGAPTGVYGMTKLRRVVSM